MSHEPDPLDWLIAAIRAAAAPIPRIVLYDGDGDQAGVLTIPPAMP